MEISRFSMVALLLIALVLGLAESFEFYENELASEESLWALYERWSDHHTISRDIKEKKKRFNVFKENVNHVFNVNQMDRPYKLKLNKFADMTNYEFVNSYARSNISHYRNFYGSRREINAGFMYQQAANLPPSIDWRERGAVNAIKEQGNCGSCWAFSAVAAVEGINQIKTRQLLSLSEQELLDCNAENHGCNGGFMERAFEFIKQNGGVTTENNYPYQAEDGYCNPSKKNYPLVTIDGYENVPENDENALMQAVANQPVTVSIDGGGKDIQFYWKGVFDGECGRELNHGVVAVGYGRTEEGTNYWIVRNSWGVGWGEEGYLRLKRGVDDPRGLCGIAMEASYPIKL